ncbi:MAG: prolipoprotein diacylglyceryl transferase [Candidatus Marinimicrobia bacterium]|nr:prolipoprotein diacylglyceryl transferase [Candidatus Neomarinimicrobiota bacterium]|tara:strand:- start:298 stop:1122 length:825 start_codon:yes stop_codon:yes gene_type:complete
MYPVILEIGPIKIYSFGLMLVTAFYTCYGLLYLEMKRLKYDTEIASDIIFWSAVGGVLGAKIYYLIENLDRTIQDPMGMIFSGSGLVFLGGLIGSIICVSIVLKNRNLPWYLFADIIAPLIMIGYAIGRLGCFLVGDDYGLPSSLPWAVSFPEGLPPTTISSFAAYYPWIDTSGINSEVFKVHPTQLYESAVGILLFFFLWSRRKKNQRAGTMFFSYLLLAGIERFSIEFLRTNEKYLFDTFSGAQMISFLMILVGSYFLLFPILNTNVEKVPK